MAFYIESRFVDIRTLVDFSEFDENGFNQTTVQSPTNSTGTNDTNPPTQSIETLNNSQAIEEVTKIVIANENKPVGSNQDIPKEQTNNITTPIAPIDSDLVNQLSETIPTKSAESETVAVAPKIEIVDKTSLYAQYINQKYSQETAAELIKIMLNPFIIILAYRYELDETKDNPSSINLRIMKNVRENNGSDSTEDVNDQKQTDLKNLRDLLEYNRRKDWERKMQRQAENFQP